MYTTCSELVVFMYRTGKSMNNLFSYCWLVDARIRASNKDSPVIAVQNQQTKPMILIHFKSVHNYYFINIAASGKENGSKSLKHVNLMNLTAIKRVVDITEASTDGIFALVCRTNQELKVCLNFARQIFPYLLSLTFTFYVEYSLIRL